MTGTPPKAFISYSHGTVEHQERVLSLADRLRADGIDAEIDQYNIAPPEGWPLWCEQQIEIADFVLMVCTESYRRRVSGEEERGKGLGAVWEAGIIRQLLYDAAAVSNKFVPVLFSDGLVEHIPTLMKGRTRYVVDTEDDYKRLLRQLSDQPDIIRPVLGSMRPLPARQHQRPANEQQPASAALPAAGRTATASADGSVALGDSADGAMIFTGDGNVVFQRDAAAACELRALVGPPVPRQLPLDLADFTGRTDEIATLERALGGDGGAAAITAIGGMGGVGKTALAVHVAHRLMERYADGQIVVDLKGTSAEPLSPAAAMGLVITALDPARNLPDDDSVLAGLYRSLLGGKRLLILFDNAAAADQVRELLPGPPGAAIVTSRRTVVLSGLERVPLDVLAPEEADALLLGIIGAERALAAERATLAERCGYLPLALRVAGTFLVSYADWGVAEYLAALADERERLRWLRVEGNALLDVAAALGFSLRQLAHARPALVVRWRMLAVFAGSFDRTAAAAAWAVPPDEARDELSLLVGRSMVLFDAAEQRYRLHDLMRDIALGAAEPLSKDEQGRLEEARDRHSAYFQRLLAEANAMLGEGVAAGLTRFDQERANIEAGWRWLLGQAADDEAVARRRSAYVNAGYEVLPLRQHPREQIEWFETALSAAQRSGDRKSEGNAFGGLGDAYTKLSEAGRAIELYEQALVIFREIGDRLGEGTTFDHLGLAYDSLGEHRRAIEYHEQALVISCEISNRRGEGAALSNLGLAYTKLDELRLAIGLYEQALVIFREIGNRQGEGAALDNLGMAYRNLGKYRRAIEYHKQALVILREIGDRRGEGTTLGSLGLAYASLGEARRAITYYEQHLAIAREIGDRGGEGYALANAALAFNAEGARDEAIARMKAAAEIFAAIKSPNAEQARTRLAAWQDGSG